MRAVWSPRPLTVIRSEPPSGAAESENGCAVPHESPREEAPEEELPGAGAQAVEVAAGDAQRHDPGPSTITSATRSR